MKTNSMEIQCAMSSSSSSSMFPEMKSPRRRATHQKPLTKEQKRVYVNNYTLNSLWSIWYGIISIVLQIYIVSKSVKQFTHYLNLPWPEHLQPYKELNAYVVLTGLGVVILPFFMVTAIMRIGNLSNDGKKLGQENHKSDEESVYENLRSSDTKRKNGVLHSIKRLWEHSVPTASFLHIIAAMCFLFAKLLVEAEIIKFGFVDQVNIWKTELDIIFSHNGTRKVSLFGLMKFVNETERGLRGKQFALRYASSVDGTLDLGSLRFGDLSTEFINLLIPLCVTAIRYPSVYWTINKRYGIIFSAYLFFNAIQSLVSYSAFTVLHKVHVFGVERIIHQYSNKLTLNTHQSMVLYVSYFLLLILSTSIIHAYGLQKYQEFCCRRQHRLHITAAKRNASFSGYLPHLSAFVVFGLFSLCEIPLLYDFIVIYCGTLDVTCLIGASSLALHLFSWLLLWLVFTFKRRWEFTVENDIIEKCVKEEKHCEQKLLMKGEPPLLVIDRGQTFQIRENVSRKAIIGMVKKSISTQMTSSPSDNEDVYWLKPRKASFKEETKPTTESSSLSWLRNKKKTNSLKSTKSGSEKMYACIKSKKKGGKSKRTGIEACDEHSDDGDYATLRQIVNRDETEENLENITQMGISERTYTVRPTSVRQSVPNGDYELLVDVPEVGNTTFTSYQSTNPSNMNDRSNGHEAVYIHSMSESSNSPEKSSETSSGVHSASPNNSLTEKRSNSLENLLQLMNRTKPAWKSLSLQRYLNSMQYQRTPRGFANVDQRQLLFNRLKEPTVNVCPMKTGQQECKSGIYGRTTELKMSSFSQPDTQNTHVIIKDVADIEALNRAETDTILTTSEASFPQSTFGLPEKIVDAIDQPISVAPSAIAMMYTHQRRDSANFSLTSSNEDSDVALKA